jgi:hypothetical protein
MRNAPAEWLEEKTRPKGRYSDQTFMEIMDVGDVSDSTWATLRFFNGGRAPLNAFRMVGLVDSRTPEDPREAINASRRRGVL